MTLYNISGVGIPIYGLLIVVNCLSLPSFAPVLTIYTFAMVGQVVNILVCYPRFVYTIFMGSYETRGVMGVGLTMGRVLNIAPIGTILYNSTTGHYSII